MFVGFNVPFRVPHSVRVSLIICLKTGKQMVIMSVGDMPNTKKKVILHPKFGSYIFKGIGGKVMVDYRLSKKKSTQ
jgi:hypothetical protein